MILFIQQVDNSHLLLTTVVAILAALVAAGFLESKILNKLGWADAGKSVGFAVAVNMITPVLAFVFLVLAFVIFSAFGIQSYTNFQERGGLKLAIYLLFPLLIIILRTQMLKILQIKTGATAWIYSFIATKITFWIMAIFIYLFYEFFKR